MDESERPLFLPFVDDYLRSVQGKLLQWNARSLDQVLKLSGLFLTYAEQPSAMLALKAAAAIISCWAWERCICPPHSRHIACSCSAMPCPIMPAGLCASAKQDLAGASCNAKVKGSCAQQSWWILHILALNNSKAVQGPASSAPAAMLWRCSPRACLWRQIAVCWAPDQERMRCRRPGSAAARV